jgi:hypothetical protein
MLKDEFMIRDSDVPICFCTTLGSVVWADVGDMYVSDEQSKYMGCLSIDGIPPEIAKTRFYISVLFSLSLPSQKRYHKEWGQDEKIVYRFCERIGGGSQKKVLWSVDFSPVFYSYVAWPILPLQEMDNRTFVCSASTIMDVHVPQTLLQSFIHIENARTFRRLLEFQIIVIEL